MSKGLGKIQLKILDAIKKDKESSLSNICRLINDCLNDEGYTIWIDNKPKEPTQSQWQSFYRSIRKLENMGLIKTDKHRYNGVHGNRPYRNRDRYDQRGGESYYKTVKCLTQSQMTMDSTHKDEVTA